MEKQTKQKSEAATTAATTTTFRNPFAWVVALLVLGGIGYGAVASGIVDLQRLRDVVFSEKLMARVNGEGLQTALFEVRFEQAKNFYTTQGADLGTKENLDLLKKQVLDDMINEILLVQYGKEQGMAATQEMIEKEYQQAAAQFPSEEAFQKQLAAQDTTPENVRYVISQQLILRQVADQQAAEHNVKVSAEEVQKAYDEAVKSGEKVPALEEVKVQIEAFLRQQKVGPFVKTLVEQLRAKGTIEILG